MFPGEGRGPGGEAVIEAYTKNVLQITKTKVHTIVPTDTVSPTTFIQKAIGLSLRLTSPCYDLPTAPTRRQYRSSHTWKPIRSTQPASTSAPIKIWPSYKALAGSWAPAFAGEQLR